MNPSSLIRLILGLAIVVFTYMTYQRTFSGVSQGGKITLFGQETAASPGLLTVGFAIVGGIGGVLILLGIVGCLRSRK